MALPSFIDLHKKAEEDDSPWLLSYSDMVTLLLCFFIILVALSNLNMVKVEMMTQHFAKPDRITMKQLQQMIQEFINSEKLQEQVSVKLTSKGIEISFKDKLLFDLGKADLKSDALPVLSKISGLLNYKEISKRKISVEGHTDSLPIRGGVYPSNWELSSARAGNVVRFFTALGSDSKRFESIGYADTQPVKPESAGILSQPENRRVVVVISPESFLAKPQREEIYAASADSKIAGQPMIIEIREKLPVETPRAVIPTPIKPSQVKPLEEEKVRTPVPAPEKPAQDEKKSQMQKYFVEGQKHFLHKEYKKAIASWQQVLKLDPNHQLSKTNIERAKKALSKK